MNKFSFKKLTAVLLSAAGVSTFSAALAGCMPKKADLSEPENVTITRLAPPDDGSLPTAHTCAENIAYIVSVFDSQEQYHTYSYGVTSASIATQTTRNFRDYKNGVLLTTDLTYSSMVKSGTQTCTVVNEEGEYEVYFRTSEAPGADTLPAEAVWSEEAPAIFNERSYHYTYGLLPTELFNYIVNEQNIIDSNPVKENSDGTYTLDFTLDPKASTYYYQFGMKTRGGLSGYPEFENITFSVTFDGQWRILFSYMHEVAKVNKGIVVDSVSDFSTEYWYGEDHFDDGHYSYYDNYYKTFIGATDLEQGGATEDKLTVDVTNVLSNGFSQIMNGGAQFELDVQLGANTYKGYIFLSLDLADPLGTLALKLSLGKTLKEQQFFAEYGADGINAYYGKDFALTANLAEVKLAVESLGGTIEKIAGAFTQPDKESTAPETAADGVAETAGDPLADLMNAMTLTAGEKQAVLSLVTDDLLGLGVGIDVNLIFGINNNKITFRGGTVKDIAVGGEKLDAAVVLRASNAPVINAEGVENAADLSEYIADINSLLGADLLKVELGLDGSGESVNIPALKNLQTNVTAYADIDGVTVGAEADVAYIYNGNKISAAASVWYAINPEDGDYGTAVLQLTEFNGAPVDLKLKCNVKELADAIGTMLTYSGAPSGGGTDSLVKILNGALSSDFSSLLTELKADKKGIRAGVSVDALLGMLGVNAGVKFGSCALAYTRGEGVYGGTLGAELPALGFSLSVCGANGAVSLPDLDGYLDLTYVLEDVKELTDSELMQLEMTLNGSAEGVSIDALNGLNAGLTVYFDINSIAVTADVNVSYTLGNDKVSAVMTAWYGKDENLGQLTLKLKEVNGVPVNAAVHCDIAELKDAVLSLLDYANITMAPFDGEGSGNGLGNVVSDILSADFSELVPVLSSDSDGVKIALDTDKLLTVLGVNFNGLGRVNLAYSHAAEAKLVAAMPNIGLNVAVRGAAGSIEEPSAEGALDLSKLAGLVESAWREVDGIIASQRVAFEIERGNTYLSLDGIVVNFWGKGEIGWKAGEEYVALDLGFMLTENGKSDDATFKFIYDKNAVDKPFVRLALNDVGIDIYNDDIESVKSGFNQIYSKISALLGKDGEQTAADVTVTENRTEGGENPKAEEIDGAMTVSGKDRLMSLLFGLISKGDWVDVLNDFTLTCNGKSLALSYLADSAANVEITADGGLALYYDGAFGSRFTLGGDIFVSPVSGGLVGSINSDMLTLNMSSSKEDGSAGFMHLAYDFLFESIHSLSVENILGSNTYSVTFELNGANTNVAQLEDIFIKAEVFVTGATADEGKLAEANLDIDAAGVVIKLNVITERYGNNTRFYINLNKVMDVKLPDLKFLATQDSLYDTLKVLLATVNDTDILETVADLAGLNAGGQDTSAADNAQGGTDSGSKLVADETLNTVCDLITALLDFRFNEAVVATEVDGITTAEIDLDNIVSQFGIETGALGRVVAKINHNDHSMKTSGTTLKTDADGVEKPVEWISLSSELAERRSYEKFDRNEYISIEFLPTLIEDLVKLAVDQDGKMHDRFTLSGSINANLVGMLDVNIDMCTVTAEIDKQKGLTVSLVMHVNKAKVVGMGVPESTVGLTYQNGMLTLAKGLNTSSPEYKVMTFDYFVDHMVTKNGSVLQWWLDISGWSLVMSFVKADVNSGLTTPQDVYLYKAKTQTEDQEISMYDFVKALRVIINGQTTADFGDISDLENTLGVHDNYYGFALDAEKVTGGVLTKLYAAITRNENGIDAIKASGAIQSYVSFSANLAYKEDWTEEYTVGGNLAAGLTAPSGYDAALTMAAEAGVTVDFDHFVKKPDQGYDEKFGCFSTNGMSTDYSKILYSHVLTVYRPDGNAEEMNVRHGSTVYLYDNDSPLYADEGRTVRVLYSTDQYGVGAATLTMNEDVTVYAVKRAAVKVIVHNGENELTVNTFAGDRMPTTANGLDAITAPTYKDGTAVDANSLIDGTQNEIHIYGVFAQSVVIINDVKYTFNAQSLTYTACGKAAGFNDRYSTKGETLILENEIDGYPVTAIAGGAFANTEGKPIKSVIVPSNIVTVGELAFADNYGMNSAVFYAESVAFKGADKGNKTMPFYGCSVLDSDTDVNGKNGNEVTNLQVYYNNITTTGGDWRHFRYVSKVVSFNFYIGENGGGAHGKGTWCNLNVEIIGADLVQEADFNALVNANVSVGFKADGFYGKAQADALQTTLVNALAQYKNEANGDKYVVQVGYAESSGLVTLTVRVSLNVPKRITVISRADTDFIVGSLSQPVAANVATEVYATEENGEVLLPSLSAEGYMFLGWETRTDGGKTVYAAKWAKEYSMEVVLSRPAYKTDSVQINSTAYLIMGHANPFKNQEKSVTTISIYEGQATFTVTDKVLTITNLGVTYTVYVDDSEIDGTPKKSYRNISSSINGTVDVTGNLKLTLKY